MMFAPQLRHQWNVTILSRVASTYSNGAQSSAPQSGTQSSAVRWFCDVAVLAPRALADCAQATSGLHTRVVPSCMKPESESEACTLGGSLGACSFCRPGEWRGFWLLTSPRLPKLPLPLPVGDPVLALGTFCTNGATRSPPPSAVESGTFAFSIMRCMPRPVSCQSNAASVAQKCSQCAFFLSSRAARGLEQTKTSVRRLFEGLSAKAPALLPHPMSTLQSRLGSKSVLRHRSFLPWSSKAHGACQGAVHFSKGLQGASSSSKPLCHAMRAANRELCCRVRQCGFKFCALGFGGCSVGSETSLWLLPLLAQRRVPLQLWLRLRCWAPFSWDGSPFSRAAVQALPSAVGSSREGSCFSSNGSSSFSSASCSLWLLQKGWMALSFPPVGGPPGFVGDFYRRAGRSPLELHAEPAPL